MAAPFIQTSFAAGELSKSLFAHVDLAKFHTGAALLRNFWVDYKGGASSRQGSKFINKSKQAYGNGAPRLIPFQFSQTQTYSLEFGNQYIRFITNQGYILETAKNITAITKANPGVVTSTSHGFTTGDWGFLQNIGGMTQLNGKTVVITVLSANTFSMTDMWGVAINTTSFTTYTSGGTVSRYYTVAAPYAVADLKALKFTQSADVMTFTHPSYPIYQLKRLAQANWTMTNLSFTSKQIAPVATSAVPSVTTPTPLACFSYVVTAINAATGDESVASNIVTCQSVDIGQTAGSITITWAAAAGAASYNVYKAAVGYSTTATPVGALYGLMASCVGLQAIDGNINPDFSITPPLHQDPFAVGQIGAVTMTANGSGYTSSTVANITTSTGSGAVLQPVVISGAVSAVIIVNAGFGYLPGDTVAFTVGSGATATLTIGALTGTYPSVTSFFQQRQYYADTNNQPETFWATQPGAYTNMDTSDPSQDSDAIVGTVSAQQVNGINALISMPTGLVILTGLGAWQLTGGGAGTAVTPSSITASAQAYNGCSPIVPPLTVNYDIIYVQEKGSIVRDLSYNFFVNIYTGTDITVLASHLFTGFQITEWAWAEEPYKLIWCVRNDGVLLTLTYLKEQDVYAWTHSDTFGLYRSICSISEPPVNALYVVVQRFINNQWVYYIERMDNRIWNQVEDVWAVDAGLQTVPTYPNATLTVSAATGTVTCTTDSAVFDSSAVGKVIRTNGGIINITLFNSSTSLTGTVFQELTGVLPDTLLSIPVPAMVNEWSLWTPVTAVSGLDHLEGALVSILADGSVQAPRTVIGGRITLDPQPVTLVTIGLGFQAQFQSLPSDTGQPTIQGRRKNIPAVTAILYNSRGMKVGPTFDDLREVKERTANIFAGTPIPLFSGDERVIIPPVWTTPGQFCIQQDYPLPITVLGVIPEENIGDTPG